MATLSITSPADQLRRDIVEIALATAMRINATKNWLTNASYANRIAATASSSEDWLALYCDSAERETIRTFCSDQQIMTDIVVAVQKAAEAFPDSILSMTLEEDPEVGRKTLAINVAVRGTAEQAIACYNKFSREWTKHAHWPKRGMIRLYYNFT